MSEPEPETVTLVGSYRIGQAVEDFELPTLSGGTWRLSEARGGPVLVFFTATWCPYCGAEAPYLEREIWQRYRHRGLRVVCIDVKEGAHAMGPFVERYGWTFPVLLDDEGAVSVRFAPIKEGLPPEVAIINAHFVLDGEGVVVHRDFLNMERFDARASHVRAFLDRFLEGGEG
jgi:peroxiredoxin